MKKNRPEERNMRIVKVNKDSIANILSDLLKRSPTNYGDFQDKVDAIIKNVRDNGDKAVFDYTAQFDKAEINAENILVTEEEIKEAYEEVDDELIKVIRKAIKNIRDFHEKQIQKSWFETREDGVMLGQKVTPMETCGVYVPGGKAVYPSSVLMNIVPAHVAGVKNIIMTTPPGKDGKVTANTLVAAKEAGATKVYKVGGAQAIGALAYGTESIPKVDKIVGPGNIFVALAKKAVYGYVSIDSIAGPSEILVLADETANPRYVAADLLSQAEHDELASAILITTSKELAAKVSEGHITVSPSPTSNNFTARCSAAVPALSALQCAIPVYASISRSKPLTFGPSGAIQLVSNASCTNFCSSPCIVGDAIYIRSFMLSHPPVILSVYMYTLELIFLQLHEYSDLRKMPHDLIQRSVH